MISTYPVYLPPLGTIAGIVNAGLTGVPGVAFTAGGGVLEGTDPPPPLGGLGGGVGGGAPSHDALPAVEVKPAGQSVQIDESGGEYVPSTQLVHIDAADEEYLPALQLTHALIDDAPTLAEYFPLRHDLQAVSTVAPAVVEYFPDPQSEHSSGPIVNLNFPATQMLQEPGGPV